MFVIPARFAARRARFAEVSARRAKAASDAAKAGIYVNRFRIKSGMTIAFLVVLSLSFFWPVWLTGKLPIPADALVGLYHPFRDYFSAQFSNGVPYKNFLLTDPVLQQYPWKRLAIEESSGFLRRVLGGESLEESPWDKNLYSFGGWGASSIENIQAGTFYPMNILFFLINNFPAAWTIFIIIQPILASLFMFWWLKNSGIKQIAALFGGLVWAFSSFNLVWLEWGNIGHAGLWLPLALLCVDKIVKSKKDIVIPCLTRNLYRFPLKAGMTALFWHALLQFSLLSSLFAGHLQVTFYLLVAVGLYWFIRQGISKRSISLFLISYFLFLIFTSIQWLPTLKSTLHSNRSVEQADVLTREGFFIRPRQLVQLVAPDFFGNPATLNYRGAWNYAEQIIYVGIIPLILGLTTILVKGKNRILWFAWLLVTGGLIFSVKNPIAEIPYKLKLPILSDLQPTRLSYLITFGLAILGAYGLDNLIRFPKNEAKKILVSAGFVGLGLTGLVVASSKFDLTSKAISQRNLIIPAVMFVLIAGGVLSRFAIRVKESNKFGLLFTVYCLLFTGIDLFRFGWKFTPFSPGSYLYPVTPTIEFMQKNMKGDERYMTLDRRILPPNANIMYRLKSIEGYDPIYSRDYARLIGEMESGTMSDRPPSFGRIIRPTNYHSPVAATLSVRYVLSLAEIPDPRLKQVFQEGRTRIYELGPQ